MGQKRTYITDLMQSAHSNERTAFNTCVLRYGLAMNKLLAEIHRGEARSYQS